MTEADKLYEQALALVKKCPKLPWKWGSGWQELKNNPIDVSKDYSGPKYADLSLNGADKQTILGLRIDHYEVEWDSKNHLEDCTDEARALIVAAVNLLDALPALKAKWEREERIKALDEVISGAENMAGRVTKNRELLNALIERERREARRVALEEAKAIVDKELVAADGQDEVRSIQRLNRAQHAIAALQQPAAQGTQK